MRQMCSLSEKNGIMSLYFGIRQTVLKVLVNNMNEITGTVRDRNSPTRSGFTSFQVGQKTGAPTRCARMAIREIALWERRISLEEARDYYRCNNFQIPSEFIASQQHPLTVAGMSVTVYSKLVGQSVDWLASE